MTSRETMGLDIPLRELNILTLPDAVDVLDRALNVNQSGDTRVARNRDDATDIAKLCGCLPMALRISGALLAENPDRELAEMAALLSDPGSRLEELRYDDRAVATAFSLSYKHLAEEHQLLFRLLPVNPGPDIYIQSTAELAGVDQTAARHGLETLARAHLIQRSGISGTYTRWQMHDLPRLYAEQLSDAHAVADGREQARTRLLDHYLYRARAARTQVDPKRDVATLADFTGRDDALAWLDAERPNLVAAITMSAAIGREQVACDLPLALGPYFYWRRRFDDWLATLNISLTATTSWATAAKRARRCASAAGHCMNADGLERLSLPARMRCGSSVIKEGGALAILGHALRGSRELTGGRGLPGGGGDLPGDKRPARLGHCADQPRRRPGGFRQAGGGDHRAPGRGGDLAGDW